MIKRVSFYLLGRVHEVVGAWLFRRSEINLAKAQAYYRRCEAHWARADAITASLEASRAPDQ